MFQIDAAIMNFVLAFRSEKITDAFLFFTYLGNWQVIAGFSVVAVAILWLLRKKRETVFFVAVLTAAVAIRFFSKAFFHRQRPDAVFSLIPENGYAFPSGHAVMSVIFYGVISYFIYKICRKMWQKITLLAVFAALIFLIGFSRIYLGVHWTSDIIAGWLIGFSILVFFITVFERLKKPAPPDLKDLE